MSIVDQADELRTLRKECPHTKRTIVQRETEDGPIHVEVCTKCNLIVDQGTQPMSDQPLVKQSLTNRDYTEARDAANSAEIKAQLAMVTPRLLTYVNDAYRLGFVNGLHKERSRTAEPACSGETAAAPELLAELSKAADMLSAIVMDIEDGFSLGDLRNEYVLTLIKRRDEARAAIAKVEGR